MSSEVFGQVLYTGPRRSKDLNPFRVDSSILSIMCETFAETHVAEPEAQFESYVVEDISSLIMSTGNTAPRFIGTIIDPQDRKKTCQGVGGHLGEGITALIFLNNISIDKSFFAHIGINSGPMIRCVDFVAITCLRVLYDYYQLNALEWENIDLDFAFPIEAKTRKDGIGFHTCKSFLENGAFGQIVSYWWACRGQGLRGPVGYGIATAFSYERDKVISHCFLRPKSENDRNFLLNLLNMISDAKLLRMALGDKDTISEIQSYLEGF